MSDRKYQMFYIKSLVLCTFLTFTSSVDLPYLVTKSSRRTKYSTSTPSPDTATKMNIDEGLAEYRLKDDKGITCLLLVTDGLVEIFFTFNKEDEERDAYIPLSPTVSGKCDDDKSEMSLIWKGFALSLTFQKSPGGEVWFIKGVDLYVSNDLPDYQHIKTSDSSFLLTSNELLIPTPVGQSFGCKETKIELSPQNKQQEKYNVKGLISFRQVQVQPFMYKSSNFGPLHLCDKKLKYRDETAPIIVGSTLAVSVLLTITGYGIFRYFKVKKVQYNTME